MLFEALTLAKSIRLYCHKFSRVSICMQASDYAKPSVWFPMHLDLPAIVRLLLVTIVRFACLTYLWRANRVNLTRKRKWSTRKRETFGHENSEIADYDFGNRTCFLQESIDQKISDLFCQKWNGNCFKTVACW